MTAGDAGGLPVWGWGGGVGVWGACECECSGGWRVYGWVGECAECAWIGYWRATLVLTNLHGRQQLGQLSRAVLRLVGAVVDDHPGLQAAMGVIPER